MDLKSCCVLTRKDLEIAIQRLLKTTQFVIKDWSIKPANSEASGVLGTHSRVFVCVKVGTSDKCLQFFVKGLPQRGDTREFLKEFSAFEKEVGFYLEIVDELTQFGVHLPLPECYHACANGVTDFVILEDLSKSAYRLADRRKNFDFEHCSIALKSLAILHASSVLLEKYKGQQLDQVYNYLSSLFFNSEDRGNTGEIIFQETVSTFKKFVNLLPQFKDSVPEVQKQLDDAYTKACEFVAMSDILNVICHGDIWSNNILFKYNKQGNNAKPVDAKLVDFQFIGYGPPTLDLLLFLYASTIRSFREQNLDKLLEIYHECFSSTLSSCGVSVPKFTLQFLKEDFQRRKMYGVCCALEFLPFSLLDQEAVEECAKSESADESALMIRHFNRDKDYRSRLTEALVEYLELANSK